MNNKIESWPGEFIQLPENQSKTDYLLDLFASYAYYIEECREKDSKAKRKHRFTKEQSLNIFLLYQLAGDKLIGDNGEEDGMTPKEFILKYLVPLFE